jgi:hypothetical protein
MSGNLGALNMAVIDLEQEVRRTQALRRAARREREALMSLRQLTLPCVSALVVPEGGLGRDLEGYGPYARHGAQRRLRGQSTGSDTSPGMPRQPGVGRRGAGHSTAQGGLARVASAPSLRASLERLERQERAQRQDGPRRPPTGAAKPSATSTTSATSASPDMVGPEHALSPSTAPGAVPRIPAHSGDRLGRWDAARQMRAAAVQDVEEMVRLASVGAGLMGSVSASRSSKGGQSAQGAQRTALLRSRVQHVLDTLQASQTQERMTYADVACDLVTLSTPSRLNDRGHGFPDGMSKTRPHHLAVDTRTGREIGSVRRVDGGGYVVSVPLGVVEVRGSSVGTVMERARLLHEAAGSP